MRAMPSSFSGEHEGERDLVEYHWCVASTLLHCTRVLNEEDGGCSADQRRQGVIAASAGNHALGLAYHGQLLGIPVTLVMPVRLLYFFFLFYLLMFLLCVVSLVLLLWVVACLFNSIS